MENLNQIIEGLQSEMVETLTRWIRVPSVKGDPQLGAPFGADVRRALDMALADAKAMGFDVRNFDGYAGDVRMGPQGVNPLAILAHLDVVPAGDGWRTDPFGAEIRDGRMYGRGTNDDKGPAVAALYAMYALKKGGVPLKREVRLILGCDEESGWGCMHYYTAHCDMPKVGFSPDASFPVINTEKGLLQLELRGGYDPDGMVREIAVGERCNVVPGTASATLTGDAATAAKAEAAAREHGYSLQATCHEDGTLTLFVTGLTGHAAFPEAAKNALGQLLVVLKELGVKGSLATLADRVGTEYDGLSLGIRCQDVISGPLTCNLGILRYNAKDGLYATLDIRHPILSDHKAITRSVQAALQPDIQVTVDTQKDPHHVSPHSKLVCDLLDAYHEVTGLPKQAIAIGGGTYARVLEEGVAFGSLFPDEEELAHQANEYMSLDSLMANLKNFAHAIQKLQD